MRHLIEECAPWLTWKVAAIFAAAVICTGFIGFIVGADAGLLAVAGATPLLALRLTSSPCHVPVRRQQPTAPWTTHASHARGRCQQRV